MISQATYRSRCLVTLLALVCAFAAHTSQGRAAPSRTQVAQRAAKALAPAPQAIEAPADEPADYRTVAAELGLGTRATASHLLVRPPARDVRERAPGAGSRHLTWPIEGGSFVRGFGYVRAQRKELPHLGVDIAAKTGTPIHAAADGVVAYADDGVKGYGNLAIIVHADGAVTSYAHCNRLHVVPGQPVQRGEVIAEVGSTGISRGPHLHFEYRLNGKPTDPMARFDRRLGAGHEPALALLTR